MKPLAKIGKLVRLRFGLPYVRRADRARDRSEWIEAVVDYHRGLAWMPWRDDLKVQIGNCLKEYGDYRGAIRAYRTVTAGRSGLEAQKQISDVNRRAGSVILPFDIREMSEGTSNSASDIPLPPLSARLLPNRIKLERSEPRRWLGSLGETDALATRLRVNGYATIKLDQVGSLSLEREGVREPVLAGVVAIRGRVLSLTRLDKVEIVLGEGNDARAIATVAMSPVEIAGPLKLQVFNAWIDSADIPIGRHWLSVRAERKIAPAGLFVNVAQEMEGGEDLLGSNAYVPSVANTGRSIDTAIMEAPAEVRSASRSMFDRPVRSILAIRADQLGDVSASLAALARLRELFPDARLTVLVQPTVKAIVEASCLADEVMTVQLDYDPKSERRFLSPAEEARLRARFQDESFDLGIDLCPGDETRPLLLLSEALYLVGFNADRFTFLDFGISVRSRDKVNQLERLSHAATVMMLVEALGVAITPARCKVARGRTSDPTLAGLNIVPGGYVVLHAGARHAINRWPLAKFVELAFHIVAESTVSVVLFADDLTEIPPEYESGSDRVKLLGALAPDSFDALLSGARLMIGNDSGPKHLAASRGVPTVSVHVGRLNWNEWGQDGVGVILSKRVPCTGCGLNDIQICGRDAICIRSIRVEEVMAAVRPYL